MTDLSDKSGDAPRSLWNGFARKYTAFAFRRPLLLLLLFSLFAATFACLAANRLRVVTDLATLLPEGTPGVQALAESRRRVGSTDFFVIAAASKSADRRAIARIQDTLKARIDEEWTDAAWVQVSRDTTFFKNHALYYFDEARLIELRDYLNDELVRVSAAAMPGMVNLLEDKPLKRDDSFDIAERLSADELSGMGLPAQISEALARFFKPDRKGDKTAAARDEASPVSSDLQDRLIDDEGKVGVVLVKLEKPSTDFDYAQLALARGDALIRSIAPPKKNPDLRIEVVGAYRSFKEVDAVASDGRTATLVSVAGVLVLLLVFFRSARAVVALLFSLAVSSALTMGLTAIVFGRLTVFTVFVLALLAGMGIDFGIHLLGRIRGELRGGRTLENATLRAISDTGAAMAVAAFTTAACILVLEVGHFDGFKEFAVIAAAGIGISLVVSILTVPPLAFLVFRGLPLHKKRKVESSPHVVGNESARWATVLFLVGSVVTLLLLPFVPRVTFERDFRNLRGPKTHQTVSYGGAVGKRSGTAPSVILGKSREQMEKVHALLLDRLHKDPRVNSFITATTFVPPQEAQVARQAVIREVGAIARKRAFNHLGGTEKEQIDLLRTMCEAEPFSDADLPTWTRRILSEKDGTYGAVGHFYAKVADWDAAAVQDYQKDYGRLTVEEEPVLLANSAFILADVVRMVRADGAKLLWVSIGVLAIILGIFARSLRGAFVLYLAVGASAVWTVGLMGLLDIRIGLYNVIVVPVILGVSIDTSVHLYHRHLKLGAKGLRQNLRTTGVLVSASTWTTFAGFSGLLAVSHLGLRSIGVLGCIGIAAGWLATILILPFLLRRFVPDTNISSRAPKLHQQQDVHTHPGVRFSCGYRKTGASQFFTPFIKSKHSK